MRQKNLWVTYLVLLTCIFCPTLITVARFGPLTITLSWIKCINFKISIVANVGCLSHVIPNYFFLYITSFPVFELNKLQRGMLVFKCMKPKSTLLQYLQDYLTRIHPYETRGVNATHTIQARTNHRKFSFRISVKLRVDSEV